MNNGLGLVLDLNSAVNKLRYEDDSSWIIKWCLRQRDKALELEGEERKQFLEDTSAELVYSMRGLLPELSWLVSTNQIPLCVVDLEMLDSMRNRRFSGRSTYKDRKKNKVKINLKSQGVKLP